ncbi:MAG: hypothetical protein RLZZ117_869 [Cyanobacteriota bacterium]
MALHAAGHLGGQLRGVAQISVGGGAYQPRPFRLLRRGGALLLGLRPSGLADVIQAWLEREVQNLANPLSCNSASWA